MALLDAFNDLSNEDNLNADPNKIIHEDEEKVSELGYLKQYDNRNEDGTPKRRLYSADFYEKYGPKEDKDTDEAK